MKFFVRLPTCLKVVANGGCFQKVFRNGEVFMPITGIKRHIGVDTNGFPHFIHITTANITDRTGALEGCTKQKAKLSKVQKVLVDGGYTGATFAGEMKKILNRL